MLHPAFVWLPGRTFDSGALLELGHWIDSGGWANPVDGVGLWGVLIEVGVVTWWGGELAIAHAMRPARAKYLR